MGLYHVILQKWGDTNGLTNSIHNYQNKIHEVPIMKLTTKIALSTVSALTLGVLCYSIAFPAAANDQVKAITKENYTVQKFVEQYKNAPQEEIDQFFADVNDNDKIIAEEVPGDEEGTTGVAFSYSKGNASSKVGKTVDEKGKVISQLDLNGKEATTFGQLKEAIKKARNN